MSSHDETYDRNTGPGPGVNYDFASGRSPRDRGSFSAEFYSWFRHLLHVLNCIKFELGAMHMSQLTAQPTAPACRTLRPALAVAS